LLEYWNLPAEIVSAIARQREAAGGDTLIQILQVAEFLEGSSRVGTVDPAIQSLADIWGPKVSHKLAHQA
jgi:hypothetical protein